MKFNSIPEETIDNRILKRHLTIIKWIAITLILSAFAVPTIIISTAYHPIQQETPPNLNQTACVYVKQYPLHSSTYVTVCNMNGRVLIDIRKFINGTATKLGIQLTLQQWVRLKQQISRIDQGVQEAHTYWRTLKTHKET